EHRSPPKRIGARAESRGRWSGPASAAGASATASPAVRARERPRCFPGAERDGVGPSPPAAKWGNKLASRLPGRPWSAQIPPPRYAPGAEGATKKRRAAREILAGPERGYPAWPCPPAPGRGSGIEPGGGVPGRERLTELPGRGRLSELGGFRHGT